MTRLLLTIAYVWFGAALLAKALVDNDVGHTFGQDPIELWIAVGVAALLFRAAAETWRDG